MTAVPRLGTTLFSLTNEWRSGEWTLEQLVARVAELGLGPGLELVGFQSIRGFPKIERDFALRFRRLLEQHELIPSALGANMDVALRVDRLMTPDESADYLGAQIEAARQLGFPILRVQIGATTEVIEKVTPLAEQADVRLGMEIHAPQGVDTPPVIALRECYERIDSEYLGFIPDFGATMVRVPPGFLENLRRRGLSGEALNLLARLWSGDGSVPERYGAFADDALKRGEPDEAIAVARMGFAMFGHRDPRSWSEIMPYIVHVHAKFYGFDENGDEPSVPHAALLQTLVDGGYDGTISSEWEGTAWLDRDEADGFAMLTRHHELCRRVLTSGRTSPAGGVA